MIRNAKTIEECELRARDETVGTVKDLYFDDEKWHVRYFVVDTGSWLTGRTVLMASGVITSTDWDQRLLAVNLTQEQVRNSPHVDTHRPVSRQHETSLHDYYGWPYYWGAPALGTGYVAPIAPAAAASAAAIRPSRPSGAEFGEERGASGGAASRPAPESEADSHLRSAHVVRGYHIEATDGSIGHVEDLMIDDATWAILYILVDTRNWWPGKKVVVSPAEVRAIHWANSTMAVDLSREAIKSSPEFDPSRPVTADYTDRLEAHYRRIRGRAK